MANVQKPTIQLKVDIPSSVQSINDDIKTIESQLKPIQLSAQINSDSIKQQTQQIQSQIQSAVSNTSNSVSLDKAFNFDTKNMTQLYSQLDTYKAKLNELSSTAQAQWKIITNSKGNITGANLSYYDDAAKAMVTENYKVTTTTNEANESIKRMALSTTTYSQNAYKAQQQLQAFNAKLAEFKTTVNSFGDKNVGTLLDNNSLGTQYQKLLTGLNSVGDSTGLNAVKNQFKELQTQTSQYIESEKLLKTESDNAFNSQVVDLQNVIKEQATAQTEVQQMSDKVALLAQQMQVLETKASSAGVNLNQSSINSFTDALNNGQLEKAKTLYQQIRLEYQQLNAEMSKQLPQNAIDNMNTRAKILESTIGTIESKFSTIKLGNDSNWSSQVKSVDTNVQQLKTNLDNFNKAQIGQDKVEAFNKLNTSVKDTKKQVDDLAKSQKSLENLSTTSNKFQAYLNDNVKVAQKFPEAVNSIKASIQSLNSETDVTKLSTGLQKVNRQFGNLRASAKEASAEGRTFFGEFGNDLKKLATWSLGGTAIFGTINEIKQMVSNVSELDKSMTNIQMASGASNDEASKMMNTYAQMGQTLGATTTEVATSADSFLRQGKSVSETNDLIKDSMVLSKIGEIDSADATDYLTSSMKGYGVATKDAISIVDKLSTVDMESATSAGGLAEGMSKTANMANLAGVSMDKLIGYLAVVGETTQKSMDEVGTSFQAIFSRMGSIAANKNVDDQGESLNNVDTVLNKVGINLRDAQGNFRNFGTVLDEIGSKWKTYTNTEQAQLSTAIAGLKVA